MMNGKFKAIFKDDQALTASFQDDGQMAASFGETQKVSTGNYDDLTNKPSIENVTLQGNKTIDQIGVGTMTVQEIEKILYLD